MTKTKVVLPFSDWELAAMSAALYFYADNASSWPPQVREHMKSLAHRLALAKPGVVTGPRPNAVYARKEEQ